MLQPDRSQILIHHVRFAFRTTWDQNTQRRICKTHIAFPRQKWMQERPSLLRYTYILCLVNFSVPWNGADTPHSHLVCRGPRKSRAIPLLTVRAFVAYKKGENLPT